ncbi:MAG TPA: DUF2934 domain-containing protein [Rhizomicrobium sp.]|nr:DUF2934 domain-containing protein [Rhizomicrobium sp.]
MIREEIIRRRSYEIWEREGRPDGRSLEHWLRAKGELEAELQGAANPWRNFVMPRLPATRRPERVMSVRITANDTAVIAARR